MGNGVERMSYIIPAPYKLTDAEIASVISQATVNGKLTDAGISAVLSAGTVGSKMAGVGLGGVGSFAIAYTTNIITAGNTVAGSSLTYSNGGQTTFASNPAMSGTWRATGYTTNTNTAGGSQATVFQRIA